MEALATLKPILRDEDPEATVTAGNASGQNDAAAMCVVTTPARAAELGLTPLVRLVSWAVAGVDPAVMGIGPVPASAAALSRAGLRLADIEVIELNEAFAAQALAVLREWGPAPVITTGSTSTAPGSPWDIRWEPPGSACWRRWRANCTGGRAATVWRRCASAVVRVWPRSSNESTGCKG